jgi:hypothetical protein
LIWSFLHDSLLFRPRKPLELPRPVMYNWLSLMDIWLDIPRPHRHVGPETRITRLARFVIISFRKKRGGHSNEKWAGLYLL